MSQAATRNENDRTTIITDAYHINEAKKKSSSAKVILERISTEKLKSIFTSNSRAIDFQSSGGLSLDTFAKENRTEKITGGEASSSKHGGAALRKRGLIRFE